MHRSAIIGQGKPIVNIASGNEAFDEFPICGDTLVGPRCSVPGCPWPSYQGGLCLSHCREQDYPMRFMRTGPGRIMIEHAIDQKHR